MPSLRFLPVMLVVAVSLAGCASTNITDRDEYVGGPLPKPGRILVYDFAATPGDLPAWSEARDAYGAASVDPNELEAGRELGATIAGSLVEKVNDMGMNAIRAKGQPGPQLNDIAIIGYFSSIDPGSRTERLVIGFGKGAADVNTHVEGWRMTEDGMVRLGSGNVGSSGGSKGPGLVVPALVTVATANPIGLAVSGAVKAEGEISGRTTDKGSAERIAGEVADVLQTKFEEQGWI